MFELTSFQLLLIGVGFVACCYIFPPLAIRGFHPTLTGKEKVDAIDAYRKTLAQVIGGLALVATFGWTLYKDRQTLDQGKAQLANQQFLEGAKLLKEDVGPSAAGVNALGQVAATHPEYQYAVLTTLVSLIKSGKAITSAGDPAIRDGAPGTIPANIQAAVSMIARRSRAGDEQIIGPDKIYREDEGGDSFRLNLYRAYLVRARFSGLGPETAFRNVNFQAASLYGADFHGLDLSNTAFDGSRMADWEAFGNEWTTDTPMDPNYIDAKHLFTVNFAGAKLIRAGFDNVWMGGANLKNAELAGASFYRADLSRADLTGAKNVKNGASFEEATLTDTIFAKTDIEGVNFRRAKLRATDFRGATNVEKADFTDACIHPEPPLFDPGIGTKLKFKPCAAS